MCVAIIEVEISTECQINRTCMHIQKQVKYSSNRHIFKNTA